MLINGAAIYVVDCSSIIVNHNVALIFQSNSGLHQILVVLFMLKVVIIQV